MVATGNLSCFSILWVSKRSSLFFIGFPNILFLEIFSKKVFSFSQNCVLKYWLISNELLYRSILVNADPHESFLLRKLFFSSTNLRTLTIEIQLILFSRSLFFFPNRHFLLLGVIRTS